MEERKHDIATGTLKGRNDLLSLLVRANMDGDVSGHVKLTDEEVMARMFPSTISSVSYGVTQKYLLSL